MYKLILFSLLSLFSLGMTLPIRALKLQKNNPPKVKIIVPANKSYHDPNNQIRYRIQVSDPEDGESEYDEIAANEVFLEVRYLPDASKVTLPAIPEADPKGLMAMKKSNCFNCHAFNGKLIAPSFYEISKRYPQNVSNIELLSKRIQEGSNGIWGGASMPSHPELLNGEARDIALWILENGQDPALNYYTGTEGTIKIKAPDNRNLKGAFLLSATYTDHGTPDSHEHSLTSKDMIVVYAN